MIFYNKTILCLFLILFCYPKCPAQTNQDYFPIAIGNSWTYSEWGIDHWKQISNILDTIRIDSTLYYYYGYNMDTACLIHPDSLGRIWRYENNKKILWFDFTITEADSYFYNLGDTLFNYVVKVKRNLTMETKFGVLNNCILFMFDVPGVVDEEYSYTFAPYLGIIRKFSGMGILHILDSAVINGKIITGIEQIKSVPTTTFLLQNYPNPFNPFTTIRFTIAKQEKVLLKVYNIAGQLVDTLVDDEMIAGEHNVLFDANFLPSGLYFAILNTGNHFAHRKMVLVK